MMSRPQVVLIACLFCSLFFFQAVFAQTPAGTSGSTPALSFVSSGFQSTSGQEGHEAATKGEAAAQPLSDQDLTQTENTSNLPAKTAQPLTDSGDRDEETKRSTHGGARSTPQKLSYFGYDVFRRFSGNGHASVQEGMGPNYVVGPGDEFFFCVWGRNEASFTASINIQRELIILIIGSAQVTSAKSS